MLNFYSAIIYGYHFCKDLMNTLSIYIIIIANYLFSSQICVVSFILRQADIIYYYYYYITVSHDWLIRHWSLLWEYLPDVLGCCLEESMARGHVLGFRGRGAQGENLSPSASGSKTLSVISTDSRASGMTLLQVCRRPEVLE